MAAYRVPDVVAKTAGVSLKSTVRVLRALGLLADCEGTTAGDLITDPMTTAWPDDSDRRGCEEVYSRIAARYPRDIIEIRRI